ncbi:MAG: DUF4147 domain-containing protein, partial [Vicinamibacteria bacterium]
MTRPRLRAAARKILRAGLEAVEPSRLVQAHLRVHRDVVWIAGIRVGRPGRLFVVSVGKAAVPMARAAHEVLGESVTAAIVIAPCRAPRMPRTRTFVAGHP